MQSAFISIDSAHDVAIIVAELVTTAAIHPNVIAGKAPTLSPFAPASPDDLDKQHELGQFPRACLKMVASAILADVEPWLPARRIGVAKDQTSVNSERFGLRSFLPGGRMPPSTAGKDACRHIFRKALAPASDTSPLIPLPIRCGEGDKASLFEIPRSEVHLLDAGAGAGAPSAALVKESGVS